ncbi:WD40-repeat-containing domain protein [Pyronema omphalodes]|nr:WD40-repeat-containing domain protein [Pyronema omphalodes]
MRFLKPGWLTHSTDKKACEVYSLHVSPDGQRLATGGFGYPIEDGNVRIWSTDAIYKSHEPAGQNIPKQLCSLSHHSGAVLTVRFSGNNRYLASGSDDKIVLVYERDQTAGARPVFGSGESQTEVWRTHRRLAGHDNDVSNCGWSADSSNFGVCWGLCFDPANKYFATASDDRTVKLIKFSSPNSNSTAHDQAGNFVVETSIDAPFSTSPLTTYFDDAPGLQMELILLPPNATNGPVSSVAIINRGNWDSEINLIGHEAPVEVCAFAPRMFTGTPPQGPVTVIACAGQDKALSIWNTSNPSAVAFDDGDLGHVLPVEENEMILQNSESVAKNSPKPQREKEVEGRMGALMMDGTNGSGNANGDVPMANTGAAMEKERPFKQKITITKDGKKRVAPLLVSTGGVLENLDPKTTLDLSRPFDGLPKGGMAALAVNNKRISVISAPDLKSALETPEFLRPAIINPSLSVLTSTPRCPQVPRATPHHRFLVRVPTSSSSTAGPASHRLDFRGKQLREPTRNPFTGRQSSLARFPPSLRSPSHRKQQLFSAACEDGTVHTYSPVGRRLMNPLILESTPCFLAQAAAEAVISIGSGDGFVLYNKDMMIWQRVTEAWWAAGSQYWDTSGSYRSQPAASGGDAVQGPPLSAGIIPLLERRTTTEVLLHGRGRWLQRVVKLCSVSIAHLENRIAAALLRVITEGFRGWIMTYVRRIANRGD